MRAVSLCGDRAVDYATDVGFVDGQSDVIDGPNLDRGPGRVGDIFYLGTINFKKKKKLTSRIVKSQGS